MITARAAELDLPAGEVITCVGGWNIDGLGGNLPTLDDLDAAAPHNPVYLSTTGPGGAVTNTLGKAFFTSRTPPVPVNANGTLSAAQGLAALQAVQTDASKQQGTAEVMDFATSLGITMFHDHGGLSGLQPYQYALNLWRQKQLKVRVRPWFWSGDDDGVSVAETRISNDYNMVGDDVWRQLGVGERINTSTTNPLNTDAWVFAAQHGWMVTQHSLTAAEVAFHISAYQAADMEAGPIIGALRWSLCHVNPITDAQIQAVKDLGIGLNIQGTPYTSAAGAAPSGPPCLGLKVGDGRTADVHRQSTSRPYTDGNDKSPGSGRSRRGRPCPCLGAHRIMMTSPRLPPRQRAASAGHVRACCPPAPRPLRMRRAPPRSGRACGVGRLERSAAGDSL
jgi:predicted amidohydrolase YtcJ